MPVALPAAALSVRDTSVVVALAAFVQPGEAEQQQAADRYALIEVDYSLHVRASYERPVMVPDKTSRQGTQHKQQGQRTSQEAEYECDAHKEMCTRDLDTPDATSLRVVRPAKLGPNHFLAGMVRGSYPRCITRLVWTVRLPNLSCMRFPHSCKRADLTGDGPLPAITYRLVMVVNSGLQEPASCEDG